MNNNFLRVACVSPRLQIADCKTNANEIISKIKNASEKNAEIFVAPALSITGASCGSLFFESALQRSALFEIERIADETKNIPIVSIVGMPFSYENFLFNCIAILFAGKIVALIPSENEKEFFANGNVFESAKEIFVSEKNPCVLFGKNILLFDEKDERASIAFSIGNDFFDFEKSFCTNILVRASAQNEIFGASENVKKNLESESEKTISAIIFANAGAGESTEDTVFSGSSMIAETGEVGAAAKKFSDETIFFDIDFEKINSLRLQNKNFLNAKKNFLQNQSVPFQKIRLPILHKKNFENETLYRTVFINPFLKNKKNCAHEILTMQAYALSKRLLHTNIKKVVLGISGGLDSTLALLAVCKTFDEMKISRKNILCFSLPAFGTSTRTHTNAEILCKALEVSFKEINLEKSLHRHFSDIVHDEAKYNAAFENAQARERTQILMDIANDENALVVGTGDLSESALGWCTYGGDHLSMYAVNAGIPKTVIRHIVSEVAEESENETLANVLRDILATPVSPELLPSRENAISQKTEDIVGPYDLHDFYLYYVLRFHFSPKKILFLADNADFSFSHDEKKKWLKVFYKRFFSSQFKRSCSPASPAIFEVSLSPRAFWKMPSDAEAKLWLDEIETLD